MFSPWQFFLRFESDTLDIINKISSQFKQRNIKIFVVEDEISKENVASLLESGVEDCVTLETFEMLLKSRLKHLQTTFKDSEPEFSELVGIFPASSTTRKEPKQPTPAKQSNFDKGATPQQGHGELVLIIDDDVAILMLVNEILSAAGYRVEMASRGMEGIMRYRRKRPDMIILDINMPDLDGFEVSEHIKHPKEEKSFYTVEEKLSSLKNKKNPHVPILFLTAKASLNDVLQAVQAGADGYLVKPFEPMELLDKTREMLLHK